jgi:hypothetical protein
MRTIKLFTAALLTLTLASCDYMLDIYDEYSITTVAEAKEYYGGERSFIVDGTTLLYFGAYDDNVSVCIDGTMGEELINISIIAVEEYDALEYISLTYHVDEDGCDYESEIVYITSYRDSVTDVCSDDDSDVLGCNVFEYESSTGIITNSGIYFNLDLFDDLEYEVKLHTAVHELGHTFGLIDLEEPLLEPVSIMYYSMGEIVLTSLTEWDKANLAWMYNR